LFQANVSELAARVESQQRDAKFRKSRVVRRGFFVSNAPGLCQTNVSDLAGRVESRQRGAKFRKSSIERLSFFRI
jgi:hypothetical protein